MIDTPAFRNDFTSLPEEVLDAAPKVLLNTRASMEELASQSLVYAERVVDFDAAPQAFAEAAEAEFTCGIVVRCENPEQLDALANPFCVGVTGNEAVAARAFELRVPFQLDAEISAQVQAAAPRILRPFSLFDDFSIAPTNELEPGRDSAWVRDREIPVLCDAWEKIEDLEEHPAMLLRSLGFRAVIADLGVERLAHLRDGLGVALDDVFELTVDALGAAFLARPLREQLLREQLLPGFEQFMD